MAEPLQHRVLASIARLLKPEGVLLMSTLNPVVTQRQGGNHHHIREMSQAEFQAFPEARFKHVVLMKQAICVDIGFDRLPRDETDRSNSTSSIRSEQRESSADQAASDEPLAWPALCSASETAIASGHQPKPYQSRLDYVGEFVDLQTRLNRERMANHQALDRIQDLEGRLRAMQAQPEVAGQLSLQCVHRVQHLAMRLHHTARRFASRAARLLPARFSPSRTDQAGADGSRGYAVRMPSEVAASRPRVLHIIPNFMTGGSSRRFIDVFRRERPDFLHVHWWGDCDTPWYQAAFDAAAQLGIPVIENINTPIAPWVADQVKHYVYVSDQVRLAWGQGTANESILYPGSDFSMFRRSSDEAGYGRCVGMVYRLERDKLDETAIEPLICVLQVRADAQALIVGGGSLLSVFRDKVTQAGVADRAEFTGYVPYEALPDLYLRMAVFVAPVRQESFGQVSPFAMSMEVPVCGYDVDALSEVIGDASMLAPASDADRLAQIVVGLLDSPERLTQKAAQQCSRARERFSVEAMVQGYEQLYARMVNIEVSA